jgi:acid phosphatase family membrane protein YuiD
MEIIKSIVTNHVLIAPAVAWLISQVLKTVLFFIKEKKLDIKRIVGDGGMPSGHSATVVCLAVMAGYAEGFGSAIFAVAIIFSAVVIRDAVGVRREVGKQARILKELTDKSDIKPEEKLKLISGHTIPEILIGMLIGVAVSVLYIVVIL